jgi:glycosyltransferase involved in cell wall biosynthesis
VIVADVQAVQSVHNAERGIARYVAEVTAALERRHPHVVDAYLWNPAAPFAEKLRTLVPGDKLRSFADLDGADVDVLHIGSPFERWPLEELLPPVRARRLAVTCYDLIPFRFPTEYLPDAAARARYQARLGLIQAADAVITDSRSAALDVSTMLGYPLDRTHVAGAGVGERFRPPETPLADRLASLHTAVPGLRARYVLVPAAMDWRKNWVGAVRAYAGLDPVLRRRHQLVLACKIHPEQQRLLDQVCAEAGVLGEVLSTGYVTDDELVTLYQSAELVMFPSFYEGFGLPVAEARRCGARVICGDASSLPEVMPEPAARFNPHDLPAMTAVLRRALTDPAVAVTLDRAPDPGFTWDRAADVVAGVLVELQADARRVAVRRGPSSVGVIVRADPAPHELPAATVHRLRALAAQGTRVVCFVDRDWSFHLDRYGVEVQPLRSLASWRAAGDLDRVVEAAALGEDGGLPARP